MSVVEMGAMEIAKQIKFHGEQGGMCARVMQPFSDAGWIHPIPTIAHTTVGQGRASVHYTHCDTNPFVLEFTANSMGIATKEFKTAESVIEYVGQVKTALLNI